VQSKYKFIGKLNPSLEYVIPFYLIRPDINNGPWVAGSSVKQLLTNGIVETDYDVFFSSQEQLENTKKLLDKNNYVNYSMTTSNSYTYNLYTENMEFTIQLIAKEFFKTYVDVLDAFDFVQSQLLTDGYIVIGNTEWQSKSLILENFFKDGILKRLIKYYSYGYDISPEIYEKIRNNELKEDFSNDDY